MAYQPDNRYQIYSEYMGYHTSRIVIRFCGDYIGHTTTEEEAMQVVKAHTDKRLEPYEVSHES